MLSIGPFARSSSWALACCWSPCWRCSAARTTDSTPIASWCEASRPVGGAAAGQRGAAVCQRPARDAQPGQGTARVPATRRCASTTGGRWPRTTTTGESKGSWDVRWLTPPIRHTAWSTGRCGRPLSPRAGRKPRRRRFAIGRRRRRARHAGPRSTASIDDLTQRPLDSIHGRRLAATEAHIGRLLEKSNSCKPLPPSLPSHLHERLQVLASKCALAIPHGDHRRVDQRGRRRGRVLGGSGACSTTGSPIRCTCWSPARGGWPPGDFDHRIQLTTHDEMAELADAMNDMTARFRESATTSTARCRSGPSRSSAASNWPASAFWPPAWRTRSTIRWPRSRCAPNRSKAGCSELLERPTPTQADDVKVVRNYLQMIQNEAFRCKGITEKLLDFSRMGDVAAARRPTCASWCRA